MQPWQLELQIPTELGWQLLLPLLWQSGVSRGPGSFTSGVLLGVSQWQATVATLNRSFQEFGFKLQIGKNIVDSPCNLFPLLPPFFILFGVVICFLWRNSCSGATGGGLPQCTFILGIRLPAWFG